MHQAPLAIKAPQARYTLFKQILVNDLAGAITPEVDALVVVPSESDEMLDYRDAILRQHSNIVDISSRVQRAHNISSTSGHNCEERMNAMTYTPSASDNILRRLLILDDVVDTGCSIASLVKALYDNLNLNLQFAAACLVWM
jgi:predicted amidophosphoribosyltransferase